MANFLKEIQSQSATIIQESKNELSAAENLLADYDRTVNDESIDFDLILHLIRYIHKTEYAGSILVFLPGYDDIMFCQEYIINEFERLGEIVMFLLHGGMQIGSQRDVFRTIPGKRKVILATNIAETSITIDDVVFVIDSGKAKVKTYDAVI